MGRVGRGHLGRCQWCGIAHPAAGDFALVATTLSLAAAWVGQVLFGLFVLLETVPRLASGSDLLIMVFSVVALVPLAVSAALLMRSELSRA